MVGRRRFERCIVCSEGSGFANGNRDVRGRVRVYHRRVTSRCNRRCTGGTLICRSRNFSNNGAREPRFGRVVGSSGRGGFATVIICQLSHVDHGVKSFTGLVASLASEGVSFVSVGRRFSASGPVNETVVCVSSIFSRLRHRAVTRHVESGVRRLTGANH